MGLFKPSAPVAVVAGDIHSRKFEEQLSLIASKFDKVIAVMGNHEWYAGKSVEWRPKLELLPDNVSVLSRGVCEYKDTVFIGATLWTDFKSNDFFVMNTAKSFINDFRLIRAHGGEDPFTPKMASELYMKDKAYIKLMVEEYRGKGKKVVIVTHFMPSYELVNPKWKTTSTNDLNYYFSASCDELIEFSEADAWVCGHTHDSFDVMLHGVRCVCNPMGYPGENNYTDKVIKI
jgi:predicted phosphodiesterase